jgi:hypothetical protein
MDLLASMMWTYLILAYLLEQGRNGLGTMVLLVEQRVGN